MRRPEEGGPDSPAASEIDAWKSVRAYWPPVIVGLAYYVGCLSGFALRFPGSGISFFWPPTAVLTAGLICARPHSWAALVGAALVGHAVAHATDGVPVTAWLIQFAGNAFQAVFAAVVVTRWLRTPRLLADTRSVLTFLVGACFLAPAIASLIPAAVYVHLGWAPGFWDAWLARAVTNAVASMTLIPPLVVATQFLLSKTKVPRRWIEFVVLLVGMGTIHAVIGHFPRSDVLGLSVALYAPTPFLIWAIVRFGAPGLSFALLWTTGLTIAMAAAARGPFGAGPAADTVLGAQVFVGANAALMMLIAGLFEEQRTEHARLVDVGLENSLILSRLRTTQQRYELAAAAGGVGVWEIDLASEAIHIEGNLKALLGYADRDTGGTLADWMRLIAPIDHSEVQSRLDAVMSGAMTTFEAEFRMCHRDGSLRWIASKGAVTTSSDGARALLRGTYADVTARKHSDRALREATDALARTWRISAMAELSASLAHELNQPLAAIATNSNACLRWMEAGTSTDAIAEALEDVVRDSLRAGQIVERTRSLFSNHATRPVSLDLNRVVLDIVEIARPRLRELQVALDLSLGEPLPDVVADPLQVQQVLLNLIMNATDAMRETPESRRVLHIRTRHGRNLAVINVRDTGTGFHPDNQQRLFDPFFTTKDGGTGMGLAISRSIIESHGGSLHALTNAGDGATFRIKMPTAEQPTELQRPS
jgi:two-component system, LuxR family, sensor kinase FixL